MKKLEISQMENLQGALSNRDCMLRGAGIVILGTLGFLHPGGWFAAGGLLATSGDCY
jgi:hypothetical protein